MSLDDIGIGTLEIDAKSLVVVCSLYLKRSEELKINQLNEAFADYRVNAFEVKMLNRFKRIIPAKWYDKIHSMLMASIQADYEDKLKRVQELKPSELMVSHFTDDIINSGLFRRWAIADLKKACESLSNHPDQQKIRISTETAGELHRVF